MRRASCASDPVLAFAVHRARAPMTRSFLFPFVVLVSTHAAAQSLPEAMQHLQSAQQSYRACRNGKLQLEFSPLLTRLEQSRRSLEKSRRDMESLRRSLESTRRRIEASHQARHASKEERDAKEAQYAQSLQQHYDEPLRALRPLLTAYVEGIDRYASVFEATAAFCATEPVTTASARTFVKGLEPAVASLDTAAQTLVADVARAGTSDVAAR